MPMSFTSSSIAFDWARLTLSSQHWPYGSIHLSSSLDQAVYSHLINDEGGGTRDHKVMTPQMTQSLSSLRPTGIASLYYALLH